MPTFKSDGPLPTGSIDLTILEIDGELFAANNFQWSEGLATDVKRYRKDGTPSGSKGVRDFMEGSCDLQLADADATEPKINNTFVYGDYGWWITQRGLTRAVNDEYKFSANIRRCENPLITEPVAAVALTQSSAMTAISSAATGPGPNLTYTWSATNLPTGVSINSSTGEISGTPTTVETTSAVIKATATDADGNTVVGVRTIPFTVTAPST